MASRIVQYFADKLKSMKEYPITLTKAVYDENGNRLDNKLSEIDDNITGLNSSLSEIDIRYNKETGGAEWSPRGADTWSPFKSVKLLNASTGNGSFSVSDIEGFKKFTVDNFYFVPISVKASCARNPGQPSGTNMTATITPTITYNPNTGTVSLSNCSASFSGGDPHITSITVLGKLYCIY